MGAMVAISDLQSELHCILAIFNLQVISILPMKISSQLAFWLRRRIKPSWISDGILSYFWSTTHPDTSYQVLNQLAVPFRNSKYYQDGGSGSYLGFPILAIFYLKVSLILPTKFWVNWSFCSGEEIQNRFPRWPPWQPSWISELNNFSYFFFSSTSNHDTYYQVSSQLAFWLSRNSK